MSENKNELYSNNNSQDYIDYLVIIISLDAEEQIYKTYAHF